MGWVTVYVSPLPQQHHLSFVVFRDGALVDAKAVEYSSHREYEKCARDIFECTYEKGVVYLIADERKDCISIAHHFDLLDCESREVTKDADTLYVGRQMFKSLLFRGIFSKTEQLKKVSETISWSTPVMLTLVTCLWALQIPEDLILMIAIELAYQDTAPEQISRDTKTTIMYALGALANEGFMAWDEEATVLRKRKRICYKE